MEEAAPLSWVALLTLMVDGPAVEPTLRGVIRSFDGTDEQRHHFGWTAAAGDPRPVLAGAHPGDGPGEAGESFLRVWCDGPRLRTEGLDGQVFLIGGADTCWQFDLEDERPLAAPQRALRYWAGGTQLLERRTAADFLGDDFTRPTGPVTATTFLGRAAWAVELAPPSHKPYPIQLVVDAETGRVLQQRNDGFGSVDEWVELAVGESLDPGRFEWHGPVRDYRDEQRDYEAEHAALIARGRDWFAVNVTAAELRAEFPLAIAFVHEYDDETGAFQASLGEGHIGMLARRPRSIEPWELGWSETQHRWSSPRWDWALTFYREHQPTPASVDALKHRLDPEA